jgi:hypothetical protein
MEEHLEIEMQSFSQHIREAKSVTWVRPSLSTLKTEYAVEYKKHLSPELGEDPYPTEKSFLKAIESAYTEVITPSTDREIRNRSHTTSMKGLLNLIKGYRSYPKFRNEKTLEAMKEVMVSGGKMDMPIVVEDTHGNRRVFSGNTRMDMAFILKMNPTVLVLTLPKGIKI